MNQQTPSKFNFMQMLKTWLKWCPRNRQHYIFCQIKQHIKKIVSLEYLRKHEMVVYMITYDLLDIINTHTKFQLIRIRTNKQQKLS